MAKITEKRLIASIKGTGGIVSAIARKLGVTWNAARNAIDANPAALRAWHDEREGILDLAESALVKSIQQGDTQDAKWLLARLGKHRGYAERIEFQDVEPLEILRQLKAENKITEADIPTLLPDFGETLIKQLFGEQALVSHA